MKVKVMSRKEATEFPFVEGDYLIAIRSVGEDRERYAQAANVVLFDFDDDNNSMKAGHAEGILFVAKEAVEDGKRLFVHCGAGISRSAGVAEALHRLGIAEWDERDATAWSPAGLMPRYQPNAHVVSLIMRAAMSTTP